MTELPPAVELDAPEEELGARAATGRPRAGHDSAKRRMLVVAAVAVLVVVAAVVTRNADDGRSTTAPTSPPAPTPTITLSTTSTAVPRPPVTTPGDASTEAPLLPEGEPSTPEVGTLVAFAASNGVGYYLYEDGRLIEATVESGAYGERRLTPDGVERVRSVFLASGTFDSASLSPDDLHCMSEACVRAHDGRLLSAFAASDDVTTLVSYLTVLDPSLPENEWVDKRTKPYVAPRIVPCVQTYADVPDAAILVPHERSVLVSLLPPKARVLLEGRAVSSDSAPQATCFNVTLEEARTLVDEFLSTAVGGLHQYFGIVIRNPQFGAINPDVPEGIVEFFQFNAPLPNGLPGL